MTDASDTRIRILRVLELLQRETDPEHPITLAELLRLLRERWGIESYRITLQKDLAALQAVGFPVEAVRSRQNRYYLDSTAFELPELKLLVDAVESSRLITQRKSRELVRKLSELTSRHQAAALKRNVSNTSRIKSKNEKIYYIIDAINEAINRGRKISFCYFAYGAGKRKVPKNGGKPYVLSPYTLLWNGDNYYVVGWSEKHGKLAVFRVDRIERTPELLKAKAVPRPAGFDPAEFSEKAFRLYDGPRAQVTLRCENETMNTVLDHFGDSVRVQACDAGHFTLTTELSLTPTFFAWVFEFGGRIEILGGEQAREAYKAQLKLAAKAVRPS